MPKMLMNAIFSQLNSKNFHIRPDDYFCILKISSFLDCTVYTLVSLLIGTMPDRDCFIIFVVFFDEFDHFGQTPASEIAHQTKTFDSNLPTALYFTVSGQEINHVCQGAV
jgi:hypothetical protein